MNSNDTHVKSKNAYWSMGLVMLVATVVCLLLGSMFIVNAFSVKYVQIFDLALGSLAFGVFLYLANMLWNFDPLYIYNNRMDVKSIFGYTKRTILFDDIIAWGEDVSHDNNYTLHIFTANSSYKIYSVLCLNYGAVRAALTATAKRDYDRQRARYKRRKLWNSMILFAIAGITMYTALYFYSHRNDGAYVNSSGIVLLEDVLTEQPEISRSKNGRSIHIKLKKYPTFSFKLSGSSFKATAAKAYVGNVNIGDTVYVGILKSEYHKKIKGDIPLGFWEKYVNYKFISVYDLSDTSTSYLDVATNKQSNKDNFDASIWIMMVVSGVFIFYGIKQIHEYVDYD